MIISEIIINNFRVYNGTHIVKFEKPEGDEKNITIIAGQNGFGKTSFLTALIWGLYGKMIVDVEESYKKAIYEIGGYKNYLLSILNNELISCGDEKLSFYVQLEISDIYLPSVPCSKILIRREYFIKKDKEVTTILIDGFKNELANEVGADIFINDFILPREIAKFFFFDAEKIVSLAEIKTNSEKGQLSLAYSDILGIRKYEILKYNLENVRIKLKRKSADIKQKEKIEILQSEIEKIKKLIEFNNNKISDIQKEIEEKRNLSDEFQEKLIREGNNITVEDLKDLKALRDQLKEESIKIKSQLKGLLDLAPFAISGKKLKEVYNQLIAERNSKQQFVDEKFLQNKLSKIQLKVVNEIGAKKIDKSLKDELYSIIDHAFKSDPENKSIGKVKVLLEFSDAEENEFIAIFNNIRKSFNSVFKHIVKEEKNNRLFLLKTNRKIQQAESKGTDLVSKKFKDEKQKVDNSIKQLIIEKQKLHEEVGSYQNQLSVKLKLVSELIKKVRLDDIDDKKDEVTKRLINELNNFILKFKKEKTGLFEMRVRNAIYKLMHKNNFVKDVEVVVDNEIIDILILNENGEYISKESLSKGEQQLYATAVLKALVEESGIEFPVFIDSPLQKFDKTHSNNIISYFYPTISRQVVLFPLLEKELTEEEYMLLNNKISKAYIIDNENNKSIIINVDPSQLFNTKSILNDVHTY